MGWHLWCLLAVCILSSGAVKASWQKVPQTQTFSLSCNQCCIFCSKCQMISEYVVMMNTWLAVTVLLCCFGDQSVSCSVLLSSYDGHPRAVVIPSIVFWGVSLHNTLGSYPMSGTEIFSYLCLLLLALFTHARHINFLFFCLFVYFRKDVMAFLSC